MGSSVLSLLLPPLLLALFGGRPGEASGADELDAFFGVAPAPVPVPVTPTYMVNDVLPRQAASVNAVNPTTTDTMNTTIRIEGTATLSKMVTWSGHFKQRISLAW